MSGAIYLQSALLVYADGSKLEFLCLHRLFWVSVGVFRGLFGDCLCSKGALRGVLSGNGGDALWIRFVFAHCGKFL